MEVKMGIEKTKKIKKTKKVGDVIINALKERPLQTIEIAEMTNLRKDQIAGALAHLVHEKRVVKEGKNGKTFYSIKAWKPEKKTRPPKELVMDVLQQREESLTISEIGKLAGLEINQVNGVISHFLQDGTIRKEKRGKISYFELSIKAEKKPKIKPRPKLRECPNHCGAGTRILAGKKYCLNPECKYYNRPFEVI